MIKLYSLIDNHDLILEMWGASTKHPDCRFRFSDFKTVDYIDKEKQIFQWFLECASKMTFPFHAYELTEYAIKEIYKCFN
jgi:hypothetical protein